MCLNAAEQLDRNTTAAVQPAVSIVMPCRNEARHIEECLASILALDEPEGGFEVVIADGMSNDGTRQKIQAFVDRDPRVRLVDNPDRTTPHALNRAIRAARGEIVVRIDAHTQYHPDYVVQCLSVLNESQADNVGGPALTRAGGYVQRAVAAAYHSRFAVGDSSFHQADYEGPADTVPYGCYRKSRLMEIGLFDEELVRNQDDELNFRLIQAGGTIWQSPRIRSWYTPRGSLPRLFQQYFQYGYWKVRVIQKRGRPASLRHLVPGSFAALLTALILLAPFSLIAQWGLVGMMGTYGLALIGASALTAARSGAELFPALMLTFPCYHLGYGYGFLVGVWDFVLLRRKGQYVSLTRS